MRSSHWKFSSLLHLEFEFQNLSLNFFDNPDSRINVEKFHKKLPAVIIGASIRRAFYSSNPANRLNNLSICVFEEVVQHNKIKLKSIENDDKITSLGMVIKWKLDHRVFQMIRNLPHTISRFVWRRLSGLKSSQKKTSIYGPCNEFERMENRNRFQFILHSRCSVLRRARVFGHHF